MVMPMLSVTAVGLVAAVVAMAVGRPPVSALLRGLLGSWLGFLAAAVPAVLLDVVLRGGTFLPVLGHLGAVAGAVLVLVLGGRLRRRSGSGSGRRLSHPDASMGP